MDTITDLSPLATLDETTLKPPESRVRSITGVRSRIEEMRRGEGTRSARRTKIQGLLDGNPPYPPGELRKLGRGSDSNINLRTGEGTADAAKTPYYDLIFEVPRFANVSCEYGDDPQRNYEWSETLSNAFSEMLKKWDNYDFNLQLKQWQMCVNGIGIAMFEDRENWQFRSRKIGDVLVPDDAEANIEMLEELAVPRSYLPTELYRKIKDEGAAKLQKWKVDLVKKAIIKAAPEGMSRAYGNDFESYQESLRCGDVSWGNKSNRIFVVDYFVKEFDGTITRCIVLDDENMGGDFTTLDTIAKDNFLLKKTKYADSFSEIINPFFFDIGTGLWHSVKGLGPKIFDFCSLENLLTGRLIDQAMAGLFVTTDSADDAEKLELIGRGPITILPSSFKIPNARLAENLQAPLAVKRDLQNTLQSNTGQYRQRVSEDNAEPTLGQAQMNAQQQAVLGKGAVNRYYTQVNRLYREMLRRALAMGLKLWTEHGEDYLAGKAFDKLSPAKQGALRLVGYCIKHKMPKEALAWKNICMVEAVRSIGYGSPAMRELVSNKLGAMLPMMNEVGRRNAQRTMLAPFVGQAQVDAFFPPIEEADVPDDNAWAATIENNELRKPDGEVLVTPKQDHVIHFSRHFADMTDHIQELRTGKAHPVDVLLHLHNAGPHTKKHLDAMSGDPTRKEQLQQMGQAWLMIAKVQDQLLQQVQEAAKAAEANQAMQQPQVDPEAMAALMKVRGDLELKREKQTGDMALRKEKQDFLLRQKDLMTAHDMRLKNLEASQAAAATEKAAAPQSELPKAARTTSK